MDVSTVTAAEVDRFKAWLYLEVLKSDFPNGREVVGICDIGELKQLKKFLKTVPNDGGRWGAVPDFFGRLRLMPGIELKWWFDDGPGPWIIVCQPNQDFTWALLKQEIRAKAQEIPLERKYKICADSLSLLRWILELHPEEFLSQLTPPIDDVIESEIGISQEWEDDNLRAYIEVLIEEINEQTDFNLRAVDWHKYGKTATRILVKKQEDDMQAITRSIQMLGLKRNRQVDGAKITAAINDLLSLND